MIQLPIVANLTVDSSKKVYEFSVEQTCETFDATADATYNITLIDVPEYEGAYEATPSAERQVISTKDLLMTDDFVVEPIPNNYGLIGWNGSFLTVT